MYEHVCRGFFFSYTFCNKTPKIQTRIGSETVEQWNFKMGHWVVIGASLAAVM